MICLICKQGKLRSGTTTVVLNRRETEIIITDVPASVCGLCAEYCLAEDVSGVVLRVAESALTLNQSKVMVRFPD